MGQEPGADREANFGSPKEPSKTPWQGNPLQEVQARKVASILDSCNTGDLESLIGLATSEYGFVEDDVRRIAWPTLLGCNKGDSYHEDICQDWREMPRHKDEDQVKLDVNRSFIYYPENMSEKELERRKGELSDLITEVLRRHPMLCYFQGYHDIVQVFLLVLGVKHSVPAVAHLSLLKIRDFMLPSLRPALSHLRLLPSIIYAVDPGLCKHLSATEPFFALAATLTLYAHDIQEYGDIARLFDFLLARESVVSIYLFAVIVLQRKEELLDIPDDEPEMLHSILSKLPKPLNIEALISKTMDVYTYHPPEKLPFRVWHQVSSYSVLKTTRHQAQTASQTLADGAFYFKGQAAALQRTELREEALKTIQKYRKPARALGLALCVGVLSWWIRRNGGIYSFLGSALSRIWRGGTGIDA
ncbi:MAG: hypothetical protein M1836_005187 [Candelina mexicana]|nr:MAG: hypothetical protein M1836_005187 [Candelina mexicana]